MDSPTIRRVVVIPNVDPNGLHMRPAQTFVQLAMKYQSRIEVVRDSLRVDAKSILDVMTLAAEPGIEITLEAQGDDAEQALGDLIRYIESGFANDDPQRQGPA